jgi:DNA-binding transcriptional LysR family regulator
MDLRAIECVRAVARTGTVSGAAHELHISQPALSKQLQRLEGELGLRLFHRTRTGMVLTPAGHTLDDLGEDLLARFRQVRAVLDARHRGHSSFRVACPHATAEHVVAKFLAETRPPIGDLLILPADQLDGALDSKADLAVGSMEPPSRRVRLTVAEIPVHVQWGDDVVSPYAGQGRADLEELCARSVIIPRTGVGDAVKRATSSLTPSVLLSEAETGTVAQALSAAGRGHAVLTEEPRFGLQSAPAFISGRPLVHPLFASWDPGHVAARELESTARDLTRWMSNHIRAS